MLSLLLEVTFKRIDDILDLQQPRKQAEFREVYSVKEDILVGNNVIEKSAEYTKPL